MQPSHQPNNIIAQKYEIINTLGEGGSGITYLAQDLQNNKNVALKALSLHRMTDWKAMELFEREAKILAQLNHPAIPQYLEYFDANTDGEKHFYIAQQLAPGKSLAKLVEENWRTNQKQIKDIAEQILEILIYLHSLETPVTHRDIKPQNIIRDENEKVFLVDFGAVQDTYYSTFMRGSTVVGTYGYMAPEQFRGQAVPATDLYGLGATLLFLLTHRSPGDFPTDGLKIDFRDRIKVSDDFADWLDKMLEPDLEERFSSAKQALEVLRGKQKISLGKQKPMLLKVFLAMGITTILTTGIFNNYKWAILGTLGFKPPDTICSNVDEMRDYLSKGGTPDLELYEQYTFFTDSTFVSTREKWNLLLCAIKHKSQPVAELLIANNANINDALRRAISVEYAKFLIAKGADAQLHPYKNEIKYLIDKGANTNQKSKDGKTPLMLAAAKGVNSRILELLIDNGADVNAQDKYGDTVIHFALMNSYPPQISHQIKLLVKSGANINTKNHNGETALHKAIKSCQDKNNNCSQYMIRQLVMYGADIHAKNNHGLTPLQMAVELKDIVKDLDELLIKHEEGYHQCKNNKIRIYKYKIFVAFECSDIK